MSPISFRSAGPRDLERLFQIENQCYATPWSRKQLADELCGRHGFVELVLSDAQTVGYCCCRCMADEMEILNIAVDPECRGEGLGRRLLQRVLVSGRARGICRVFLEVRVGNAVAIGLYRSLGFEQIGQRRGYYRNGEDALLLGCSLQTGENEEEMDCL